VGSLFVIVRLVVRNLRQRPGEAVLLTIVIAAATTTLTLGLALGGVTRSPYQHTRAQTHGPDVVAMAYARWPGEAHGLTGGPRAQFGPRVPGQLQPDGAAVAPADLTTLTTLAHDPAVTASSGPYPVALAGADVNGHTDQVTAMGRDTTSAAVDQPKVTSGHWLRSPGEVVVERSFADAFRVHVGDVIGVGGRRFRVTGIAVTAANAPYPHSGYLLSSVGSPDPGLVWMTRAEAQRLATASQPLSYVLNLKLANPADAQQFVASHLSAVSTATGLTSWQAIQLLDHNIVHQVQSVLQTGGWLLALLAIASLGVLVGGRLADQTRRVGSLKVVGATPRFVAAVLLSEYLLLALVAGGIGLAAGRLIGPLLTSPGAGLLGTAGAPELTAATVAIVIGAASAVALLAASVPAARAARTSTIEALNDAPHSPQRRAWIIAASARLPVPLLLGTRLAARRVRRSLLGAASVLIVVATVVSVLAAHARIAQQDLQGLPDPRTARLDQVLLVITVTLIVLAAINAVFITWSTAMDSRRPLAVARALGASPRQISEGLAAAQLIPAIPGALLGIPAGLALYALVKSTTPMVVPTTWSLVTTVVATILAVTALSALPARIGARRSVVDVLQSELG
jgi:putative ABC transport system permease protein